MAIRKIARMGHPILRRRADDVPVDRIGSVEIQNLIDDMIETMRDADGAGIAAPQVHVPARISIIEVAENPRYPQFPRVPLVVLVNPIVQPKVAKPVDELGEEESITMFEGCLSVPGVRGRVKRPRRVSVTALDRRGQPLSFEWEGIPAAIVQHETDHLDGVLFVDRADPRTLAFQREYERFVPPETRIEDCG